MITLSSLYKASTINNNYIILVPNQIVGINRTRFFLLEQCDMSQTYCFVPGYTNSSNKNELMLPATHQLTLEPGNHLIHHRRHYSNDNETRHNECEIKHLKTIYY